MNQYFVHGSGVLDVGLFTFFMTNEATWPLRNPSLMPQASFFSTHLSLFYYPVSLLYGVLKEFISPQLYFSLFIGSMYGILSLSIYLAGLALIPNGGNHYYRLMLLVISLSSSFNGIGLALIGFPHIEIAIPALLLLFLALYLTNRKIASYVAFALMLSIREDAGIHAFLLLFVIVTSAFLLSKSLSQTMKELMIVAVFALLWSLFAFLIQKTIFGGDNAFSRIYSGDPAFSHITLESLAHRVNFICENREYIYVPLIFSLMLAVTRRNLFWLSGIIAFLPWLLISFVAITPMPSTLSNYYPFPFIVALVWPVFANILAMQANIYGHIKTQVLFLEFLMITGASIFLFPGNAGNVDMAPWEKFGLNYIDRYSSTREFIECIESKGSLRGIILDEPMASLFISNLGSTEYGYLNTFTEQQIKEAQAVIFTASETAINGSSAQKMRAIIEKKGLHHIFNVSETDLFIAVARDTPPCPGTVIISDFSFNSPGF
jgi:hypothetical protein